MQDQYSPVMQNPPAGENETEIDVSLRIDVATVELQNLAAENENNAAEERVPQSSNFLSNMAETKGILVLVGVIVGIIALILAIILPISFATMEYYEMGFKQRKSSGTVNTDKVYPSGRHAVGPDAKFKVFPADAHLEDFYETVFTADRLQVTISGHFQYFLRPHQLQLLHKNFDIHYRDVLRNNAIDALKGKATLFSVREYIRNRMLIEEELFDAIRERLGGMCCAKGCTDDCVPNCKPQASCSEEDYGLFADVRYLQLSELDIPYDLAERYLRALVLQEENEAEKFKQDAQLVRKDTEAMVKEMENQAREIRENADANSRLILSKAQANATAIRERARTSGLKHLYSETNLNDNQHKSSFDYLKTISQKEDVSFVVNFQTLIAGPTNNALN